MTQTNLTLRSIKYVTSVVAGFIGGGVVFGLTALIPVLVIFTLAPELNDILRASLFGPAVATGIVNGRRIFDIDLSTAADNDESMSDEEIETATKVVAWLIKNGPAYGLILAVYSSTMLMIGVGAGWSIQQIYPGYGVVAGYLIPFVEMYLVSVYHRGPIATALDYLLRAVFDGTDIIQTADIISGLGISPQSSTTL